MQLLNGAEAWPPQGTALHLQQYFISPINEADRDINRTTNAKKGTITLLGTLYNGLTEASC